MEGKLISKRYETFKVGSITFEGGGFARPALPGDCVIVAGGRVTEIVERAEHKGLVGVLEVSSATRYGFTARGVPIYLFVPWNKAYPPFYVGSTYADRSQNILVIVDLEHWDATVNCPRGSCRRVIGRCGDIAAEEEALLWHACPNPWKTGRLLPILDRPLPPREGGSKFIGNTFHVDPPGCRDIDDAISISRLGNLIDLRIHITDVGSYLVTNPWLSKAATLGQTLYRDGQVVAGMFPGPVEEALSLLPFQTRMTITLHIVFEDLHGMLIVKLKEWLQEEIEVKESYTYDTIKLSDHAELLKEVASALSYKSNALDDPHEWIEQLMLTYNKEAAAVLKTARRGILRRHAAPDMDLLNRLEAIGGLPEHLAYSSGEYCGASELNTEHWGLSEQAYCHASSPIRRWADCVNQMHLLEILFDQPCGAPQADPAALNHLAKVAKSYERDTFFLRQLLEVSTESKEISGVILDWTESEQGFPKKLRAWIYKWKRIITIRPPVSGWDFEPAPGLLFKATLFYNPNQQTWKDRIVYRVTQLNPNKHLDELSDLEDNSPISRVSSPGFRPNA